MSRLQSALLLLTVVILGVAVLGAIALAWTNPTQNPPAGNVSAPVNIGGTAQTKSGSLFSSDTVGGNVINATSTLCISGDCKSAWSQVGQSQWTTQGSDIYYATGAVSIGTQATSSQLHVLNSTGDNILKLSRGASTSTILRVGTDGALVIQNQATDVLTIKSGNVGIGTTSPNSPLTVGSAVTTNLSPIINANSTGNRPIFVGETSGNKGVMIGYTGNDIQGRSGTNFTTNGDLVLNYYGGNVGIGTTTTTEKLTVNGNVEATAYYYPSDARLKVNIAPVGGLEVVRGLNGVSFTWRDSGKPGVGFIAQDVERVLPAAVATSPQTGMKSVDYAVIIAPLVEAVKDLDRQVAELRQEVNELKNK